ncbi:MAG: hypothetical protein JSS56_09030 [Proteobacteria bacterium]|nr:hypothetical protein [Pseudomonadota bacterium]
MEHDFDPEDFEPEDREPPLRVLPPLLLLSTETACWKCGRPMKAVALAAHALEEDGERVGDVDDTSDMLILRGVSGMPDEVLKELVRRNPSYGKRYSGTAADSYFANNCDCGTFIGDFYLHAEPGGAFFPTSETEAGTIIVEYLPSQEPVEIHGTWGAGVGDFILAHANVKRQP